MNRRVRFSPRWAGAVGLCAACGIFLAAAAGQGAAPGGWTRGKGWGWVWGKDDERGALNAMTDATRLAAAALIRKGRIYDLGVPYDRASYKWPGHSPGEVMSFRSPEGVKRAGGVTGGGNDAAGTAWHSSALFISDNVGTQIDGLGHVVVGEDNHWYNGFTEAAAGGDFGIRKCDAASMPPIFCRGVLIDVAGWKGVPRLPEGYAITPDDLRAALAAQKVDIEPGDAVFIRTGTGGLWGENGSNHEAIKAADSAGINLDSARWLVEEKGAMLVGADTSGLEVSPAPQGSRSFIPVHVYLIVEQGVPIGELHDLEALARDKVYRFAYMALVNKVRGTVAGFTLRPVALD
jgi:kynurenine formamidase